jgi:hypothetical protein
MKVEKQKEKIKTSKEGGGDVADVIGEFFIGTIQGHIRREAQFVGK